MCVDIANQLLISHSPLVIAQNAVTYPGPFA